MPVDFHRKRNFNFAGKLGVTAFLGFFDAVPKGGTVGKLRRGIGWKKNFRIDYAALFRIIVRDSVPLVCELLAAAVSGGGNGASSLTAFDDFDAAMVDCRILFGPLSVRWIGIAKPHAGSDSPQRIRYDMRLRKRFGERSSPSRPEGATASQSARHPSGCISAPLV